MFSGSGKSGLAIESEMLVDAAAAGLRIQEVEIGMRYDVKGSSENPVSRDVRVLVKVLHDMELRRSLYYLTLPGILIGCDGSDLGPGAAPHLLPRRDAALRVPPRAGHDPLHPDGLLFLALTGLILHSISRMVSECKKDFRVLGRKIHEKGYYAGNAARDNQNGYPSSTQLRSGDKTSTNWPNIINMTSTIDIIILNGMFE